MKIRAFAVYDAKIGAHMQPFFMDTNAAAIRAFIDLAQDQRTMIAKHPEDFTLMHLGSYDEETGTFENNKTPESLGVASQYLAKSRINSVPESENNQ